MGYLKLVDCGRIVILFSKEIDLWKRVLKSIGRLLTSMLERLILIGSPFTMILEVLLV